MRGKKAKLPVRYLGRIMLSIPTARVSSRLDISDIAVNCMWKLKVVNLLDSFKSK